MVRNSKSFKAVYFLNSKIDFFFFKIKVSIFFPVSLRSLTPLQQSGGFSNCLIFYTLICGKSLQIFFFRCLIVKTFGMEHISGTYLHILLAHLSPRLLLRSLKVGEGLFGCVQLLPHNISYHKKFSCDRHRVIYHIIVLKLFQS